MRTQADAWVTLVSSDGARFSLPPHPLHGSHAGALPHIPTDTVQSTGHRFILPRSAALGSEMIKNTLSADFVEAQTGVIRLEEQRAEIVEKVAEYLMYKERYKETKGEIPDFKDRVKPEIALELCVRPLFLR